MLSSRKAALAKRYSPELKLQVIMQVLQSAESLKWWFVAVGSDMGARTPPLHIAAAVVRREPAIMRYGHRRDNTDGHLGSCPSHNHPCSVQLTALTRGAVFASWFLVQIALPGSDRCDKLRTRIHLS